MSKIKKTYGNTKSLTEIVVKGARQHNLKNINVTIPRDKLVVITGLSGSGKSSLAFDTIYAEGQRRYVESLSTYARQFLGLMEKPDMDTIEGLSPAISIEQKASARNPRSTVGTVTEIHDYLRLLFAHVGQPTCWKCGDPIKKQSVQQVVDSIFKIKKKTKIFILAPVIRGKKGQHKSVINQIQKQGFLRIRINGEVYKVDDKIELDKNKKHTIEVVVDRFKPNPRNNLRIAESLETAIALSEGLVIVADIDSNESDKLMSANFACPVCNYSVNKLEPRLFSFNSPSGACSTCDGLGVHQYFDVNRVIQHPEASISEGAIRGWDRRNLFYYNLLNSLATQFEFDLSTPSNQLSALHQNKIFFGTDDEEIAFFYVSDFRAVRVVFMIELVGYLVAADEVDGREVRAFRGERLHALVGYLGAVVEFDGSLLNTYHIQPDSCSSRKTSN